MDINGLETGKLIVGYCPSCEMHYQKETIDGVEHTCRVVVESQEESDD